MNDETAEYDPKQMQFRRFGNSGLRMSVFSLGGWLTYGGTVLDDSTREIMRCAFENGINTFDTAECYANGACEVSMGKAIRDLKWRRSDVVLVTKMFFGFGGLEPNATGLSRKHVIEGTNASLDRAQLDYWDVVMAHCPDVSVPMTEVVKAFNHLIDAGKCFYWGCSAWSAQQIEEAYGVAHALGLEPPLVEQHQYSALQRDVVESDYMPLYAKYGLKIMAWSPLASGVLTGKYNESIPKGSRFDLNKDTFGDMSGKLYSQEGKANIERVRRLTAIADELGCSVAVLSLAWAASNENVTTVILGASKREQLEENLQALTIIEKLTPDIKKRIDEALDNKPAALPTYGR